MAIIDKLKGLFRPPRAPDTRTVVQGVSPPRTAADYTLTGSELIFAAVSRIANTLASMPMHLYRGDVRERGPLDDIISSTPNGYMTSMDFFRTMETCCCTKGNAYAIKSFGTDGALAALEIADPDRVAPQIESSKGEMWYRIQPDAGAAYYLHNYYVLHIPFLSAGGYTGVNPIRVLHNTLDYAGEVQRFSLEQISRGVNAQTVLEAPASLGDTQRQSMIQSFMQTYRATGSKVLLLESGVTARSLNTSPVDTNLFDAERVTRSRVAMVYNMPPHLMGDYSDASFSSLEQQMLEFLMITMLPRVTLYEQEFDRKLLTAEGRRAGLNWRMDMDTVLRADSATRANVNQMAIRSGWKRINEVRASYGLPPDADGDHLLVSRDMTTLDALLRDPDLQGGENN